MRRTSQFRSFRQSKAQSMVETALILPLVIALLFAIIDMGYYLYVCVAVSHACREGARFAAMNNRTRPFIKDWIRKQAAAVDIPATPVDAITITTAAHDPDFAGNPPSVAVTITYQHSFLVPLWMIGRSQASVFAASKMIVQTWETTPYNQVTF